MSSSGNAGGRPASALDVFKKKPFRLGFIAGSRKAKAFLPEDLYSEKWDQINYERGFHFATICRMKGLRLSRIPARPSKALQDCLFTAVRRKELI